MAIVRRSTNAAGKTTTTSIPLKTKTKVKVKTRAAEEAAPFDDEEYDCTLPTVRSKPITNFFDVRGLLYGERKIGKTTLLEQQGQTMFLMFEPGGRAISIYQREVQSYPQLLKLLDLLEVDKTFTGVVCDTADRMYELYFNFMCDELGIDAPGDMNDYGVTHTKFRRGFTQLVERLLRLPKGVWFTSHASIKDMSRRDGFTWKQLRPTLQKQPMEIIEGLVDCIAYYGYDGADRTLVIRGDEFVDAGTRLDANFVTPRGELVKTIPMGKSKQQAHSNLMRAFNNQQLKPGEVPYVQTVKPVKAKK